MDKLRQISIVFQGVFADGELEKFEDALVARARELKPAVKVNTFKKEFHLNIMK